MINLIFIDVTRDARIGARMLVKTPLFTIFAVVVLSIGIGANVTVFSYLNAMFLKPLDVPQPNGFVRIYGDGEGPNGGISYESYEQYRDGNQSFSSMGMYLGAGTMPLRLEGPRTLPIDIVPVTVTSASLFTAVGLAPISGRNIEPEDEYTAAPRVVMLNDAALRKYFATDKQIIGRTLFLNNDPHRIVGVVSRSFERIFQIVPAPTSPRVYMPAKSPESWRSDRRWTAMTSVVGRLRSDVSRRQAQADLARIASQLSIEKKFAIQVSVEPSNQPPSWLRVTLASIIALFMVGVFVVLLIACDDIAILLVARIASRRREIGVRLALGASRVQLVRQLVAENLLLAILGGAGAVVVSLLSARALERLPLQLPIPDSSRLTLDWRVFVFATALSLATTLFFGLRPALQYAWKDVVVALNPTAQSATSHSRIRSNLVITQVTVSTALLITAGLLVASTRINLSVDRGFRADHVLVGSVNFIGSEYDADKQRAFYERLLHRLAEDRQIISASIVDSLPIALPGGDYFRFGGYFGRYVVRPDSGGEDIQIFTNVVSPGQFDTLRIALVEGRDFNESDRPNSPKVGIVNAAMARRLWSNESSIGRIVRGEDGTTIEIVGVAGNIRYEDDERVAPLLYRPLAQHTQARYLPNTLLIRTRGEPLRAAGAVQAAISEIDPNLLAYNMHTLEERMERTLLPLRLFAYIAGIPGVVALLLGVVGTYGTIALVVAHRRREIGIRIALGAHPSRAVRLITTEGLKWTAIGLSLGILGALLIALWLSRNFYGLNFFDPAAFAFMTGLVAVTATAASYIPARQASRVDPMKVLRED